MSSHNNTMEKAFWRLKNDFEERPMMTFEERMVMLKRLKAALIEQKQAFCDAMNEDFGHRSEFDAVVGDIIPTVNLISYQMAHLKRWMKPQRRHAGLMLWPASLQVLYQPLGVVGVIAPWNFPLNLAFSPLASALAAGNRVMLKLSEYCPAVNKQIRNLLEQARLDNYVVVIEGGPQEAQAFTELPFDHLLFTGSTQVGRHVMAAASKNLTPVTLELGGKSPVLVAPDADLEKAAQSVVFGKLSNAGQICVAPDYVLVPHDKQSAFIAACKKVAQTLLKKGLEDKELTSIINQRHFARLQHLLQEAEQKGAKVEACCEPAMDEAKRKMALHLVSGVSDEMTLMQEEIFGPLLPVVGYGNIGEAIAYIKQRPRPLALYLMSYDKAMQQRVANETHSGGMAVNATLLHVAADDCPFGGVGESGMGQYHGYEGFITFSKAKTLLKSGRYNPSITMLIKGRRLLLSMLKWKYLK